MDNFHEEIVVRQKGKILYSIAYIITWFLIVILGLNGLFALSAMMGFHFDFNIIINLIIGAGGALALYYYKDTLRVEYEYTFTNGEMDFAKVLGNARRKQLLSLRMREVEAGGYVDSEGFARYEAMAEIKKLPYFLNSNARLYYLFFIREGKKQMVLLEPSEKMVDMMTQYSKALTK